MKNIKKTSFFISLLLLPLFVVGCDLESHYKYEGSGSRDIQYTYIPGSPTYQYTYTYTYTQPPVTVTSISQPSVQYTNPNVNTSYRYLAPVKIFDSFKDGFIPATPLRFTLQEYYPSSFIVDSNMNIIQEGTNRFYGHAYSLYMYDADGDGFRDFCMGDFDNVDGSYNEYLSIYSYFYEKELYYLYENNQLNAANFRFLLSGSDLFAYESEYDLNGNERIKDYGRFAYSTSRGGTYLQWNTYPNHEITSISAGFELATDLSRNYRYHAFADNEHTVRVDDVTMYCLDVSFSGSRVTEQSLKDYVHILNRYRNGGVNIAFYDIKNNRLNLFLTFDSSAEYEELDIMVNGDVEHFVFTIQEGENADTLASLSGYSNIIDTVSSYVSKVTYSIEDTTVLNQSLRQVTTWTNSESLNKMCDLLKDNAYAVQNSVVTGASQMMYSQLSFYLFNSMQRAAVFNFYNHQFFYVDGTYYALAKPLKTTNFGNIDNTCYGFAHSIGDTAVTIYSTKDSAIASMFSGLFSIFFVKERNTTYTTSDANYRFYFNQNFYIINGTTFIDQSAENVYTIISDDDFSFLFNN